MFKNHTRRIALVATLLLFLSIAGIGYFTFLDSEWQDWQVLSQVRANHALLLAYKKTHNSYPESLAAVGARERYCIFFKCFDIKYKLAKDRSFYTSASKVNTPFVIFFHSNCPDIPVLDEDHRSICARIGFEENYKGDRTDLPIYLKDKSRFPDDSDWPSL